MTIRIEKTGPVWTIIHSRADAKNAMDPASAEALYHAFLEFDADNTARVAVFWGEGGTFCAGFDLKHAARFQGVAALDAFDFPPDDDTPSMAAMGPSRLSLGKPVIAAISGAAVAGGMELAIWADIRVMEEDAFMGVFCRRWGVPLIDGGTVRLPRLVGEGRAMDLILTGRKVEARECLAIGLCEYVVPTGQARTRAETLARQIAGFPQSCLRADRQNARAQHGLPEARALRAEWQNGKPQLATGAIEGAQDFTAGKGRHGAFEGSKPKS